MIQSILVYTTVAISLYFLGKNIEVRERVTCASGVQLPFWSYEIIISILLFGLISGLRYQVGVDHLSYLKDYLYFQDHGHFTKDTFEIGFVFIAKVFASMKMHYFFYFAFWAMLQIGFVYYAFRKEKYLLKYTGLFIILGPFFLNWMNGIRQSIVVCAFILIIEALSSKKKLLYFLSIILFSMIHRSALFLIPVWFVSYLKIDFKNKFLLIMIVLLSLAIGESPYWLNLMNRFDKLLGLIGYEGYAGRLDSMTSENLSKMAFGPSRLSLLFLHLSIIWEYSKTYLFFNRDEKIKIYFLLFFIGVCLYNIFANTSHIFLRPVDYFTIFALPMCALTAVYLKSTNQKLKFYAFMILACSYTFISVFKTYLLYSPKESVFYKFFWQSIY